MKVNIAGEYGIGEEPELVPILVNPRPRPEWTEKAWGKTKQVHRGQNAEIHELEIKAGGYCSLHRHQKRNLFHIQSGTLQIEFYHEGISGSEPFWIAPHGDGEQCSVGPGQWHRFRALTDCKILEVYWNDEINPEDIERADEGGIL